MERSGDSLLTCDIWEYWWGTQKVHGCPSSGWPAPAVLSSVMILSVRTSHSRRELRHSRQLLTSSCNWRIRWASLSRMTRRFAFCIRTRFKARSKSLHSIVFRCNALVLLSSWTSSASSSSCNELYCSCSSSKRRWLSSSLSWIMRKFSSKRSLSALRSSNSFWLSAEVAEDEPSVELTPGLGVRVLLGSLPQIVYLEALCDGNGGDDVGAWLTSLIA